MTDSHCLVSSALDPQVRKLDPGQEYTLGRDAAATIQLISDRVSHKHARIFWSGTEFIVEDLGSKNGLSVEGEMTKRRLLKDGEVIKVGPFNLRYRVLSGDVEGLLSGAKSAVVSGRFAEGELVELGSIIQLKQLSGILTIHFEGTLGTLAINKGILVRAQCGTKSGMDAAETLLQAPLGQFEFRSSAGNEKGDLALPFADLLISVIGKGRRATRTVDSAGGDLTGDLSALRGKLQAAKVELELANGRAEFGNLFGAVLFVLFVYSLSLTLLAEAPRYRQIVNPVATVLFSFVMIRQLLRSSYPLRTFGLTTENWKRSVVESVIATLPVLLLGFLARLALHDTLEPGAPIANFHLDARFLAYPIIVPMQEIMLRGAVQTTLQRFLIGKNSTFRAILLSSSLFGLVHMHISLVMAFGTIIMSLGWGILYARHKTLIGVSVSHFLIGLFAFALWGGVVPGWQ